MSSFKRPGLYLVLVLIALSLGLGVFMLDPDTKRRLLVTIDVFGMSDVANRERQRTTSIMSLPITYERKLALVDQKIFMGADTNMVRLALGNPKLEITRPPSETSATPMLVWHYYLAGESRPTVLEFDQNILVKAYKGSAIDVQ